MHALLLMSLLLFILGSSNICMHVCVHAYTHVDSGLLGCGTVVAYFHQDSAVVHTTETSVKGVHTVMESIITYGLLLKLGLFYSQLQLIISLIDVLSVHRSQSCSELLDVTMVISLLHAIIHCYSAVPPHS
jgi:hypothetical protein